MQTHRMPRLQASGGMLFPIEYSSWIFLVALQCSLLYSTILASVIPLDSESSSKPVHPSDPTTKVASLASSLSSRLNNATNSSLFDLPIADAKENRTGIGLEVLTTNCVSGNGWALDNTELQKIDCRRAFHDLATNVYQTKDWRTRQIQFYDRYDGPSIEHPYVGLSTSAVPVKATSGTFLHDRAPPLLPPFCVCSRSIPMSKVNLYHTLVSKEPDPIPLIHFIDTNDAIFLQCVTI